MKKRRTIDYDVKVKQILCNLDFFHKNYYDGMLFNGPSLYFHLKVLNINPKDNFRLFLECIYATLTSWGMHRMGSKGSKMVDFDIFYRSLKNEYEKIIYLRTKNFKELTESDWKVIEQIFNNLEIMASGTRLVGNSKVMAHLIPNLIAPIDREYTVNFLTGNKYINTQKNNEWEFLKEIIVQFFYKIASDYTFESKAKEWLKKKEKFPWDTSRLKIIDNLIIGAGLHKKRKDNQR